jgi:hypothetical protein
MRKDGGDGGIRTLDRALQPYNGLANRRLQPLGHVSVHSERSIWTQRFRMCGQVCPSPGAMARPTDGGRLELGADRNRETCISGAPARGLSNPAGLQTCEWLAHVVAKPHLRRKASNLRNFALLGRRCIYARVKVRRVNGFESSVRPLAVGVT